METITSVENAKVKFWNSLKLKKNRDKNGLFIVQEKHLIQEAIASNLVDTLIVRDGVENIFSIMPVYVSDNVMKKLSDNVSLNDYIAICHVEKKILCGEEKRMVVLENVQDPGNVGTIIRTALSFGYEAIFLTKDCADIYNEKTIQASQGAIFRMTIIRQDLSETLSYLKKKGVEIIATDLHNSNWLTECKISNQYAIMLGNEGKGLSQFAIDNSDQRVKIEMETFESLNVAVAAAITMYDLRYRNH